MEKTNVMRILDQKHVAYVPYMYSVDRAVSAVEVAEILSKDVKTVYKTLITLSNSKKHYVFVIPAAAQLDLKKAASAVKEKNIEMLASKELFGLTGYIHGGCSPIGMKKNFPTVFDNSAKELTSIVFSAGKIGAQVELKLSELSAVLDFGFCDVIK